MHLHSPLCTHPEILLQFKKNRCENYQNVNLNDIQFSNKLVIENCRIVLNGESHSDDRENGTEADVFDIIIILSLNVKIIITIIITCTR